MKLLALVFVVAILCVVLFVAGVVVPARSKRMQKKVDTTFRKAERKSDANAGRLGDMTKEALKKSRRATDASARGGRTVNEKVTGG